MRWKVAILTLCVGLGLAVPAWAQSGAKSGMNTVETFTVSESDDGTFIRISGSQVPTFSVFKLNEPLRLFIDISNAELESDPKTERVDNGVISQVALLAFEDNVQSMTRVIIGFDEAAHYDVRTEGRDVVVFVDGEKRTQDDSARVAALSAELQRREKVLAERQTRLERAEKNYQTQVARAEATRAKLRQTETQLEQLEERLAQSSGTAKAQVKREIEAKNRAISGMRTEVKQREAELQTMKSSVSRLESERDRLVSAKRELETEKKRLETERNEALARAEKSGERARALESQLENTQSKLASASKTTQSLKERLTSVNSRVEETSQEVQRAQSELRRAKEREAELQARLSSLEQRSAAGDKGAAREISKIRMKQRQTQKLLAEREQEVARAEKRARSVQNELASARNALRARDAEVKELQRQLANARRDASTAENARIAELEKALSDERARVKKLAAENQVATSRGVAARAVPVEPNSNEVRGIRLETDGERSRIVVELERPGNFETLPWKDSRAVMILNDVQLPKALERTLESQGQSGAVRFVSSYRDNQGRVRLEAELSEDATEIVRQDGNELVWEFAAAGPVYKMAQAPQTQTRPEDASFTSAPPGYPMVVTDPTRVSRVPGMSRKRITIDLRGADIQNVLRLLAKEGGVNIVAGDDVGGSVTVRLRSVPLDEVFLTVLQARSLGFEKRGNVIRVAPQSKLLDEQSQRAAARAAAAKSKPLEVFLVPVNYADAGEMEKQIRGVLGPRGTVTIDDRTNTLVIKDIPENLAAMRSLIESLDTQVPQVLIEARIVETNDTFSQQLGIQWGGDVTWSQANGNPTGLVFPGVVGLAGGSTDGQTPTEGVSQNPNFAVNLPAPAGTGAGGSLGLTLGSVGGALNINLRLSAAESSGHAQIISAPKILTLDNRTATISQGTSIPISVVSAAGVQTVFVDATLDLTVTPTVTPDGNVQMEISATKNEPDFQNTGARGDPTIIQRQATTELLVKDGDTTVIGGIYTKNSGTSLTAVPFFHKIPILGWFFKTTSQSENRQELLIFITPKIVNRAESLGQATAN